MITIKCPECGRTKEVDRHESDPPGAVLCRMYCPTCIAGKGFKTAIVGHYDDAGNEVTPHD